MIKRILVPLDGSRLSEQALPLATTLASTFDAELLVATADIGSDNAPYEMADIGPLTEAGSLAAEQYLAATEHELASKGLHARSAVVHGRPHIAICSLCDNEAIDLVVMTTHGRSGVSRWTMGSVADKVLRTTSTPLILIHPTVHGTPPTTIARVVVPLDSSALAEGALPLAQQLAKSLNISIHLVRVVVPSAAVYGSEYLPGTLPVLEEMETEATEYVTKTAQKVHSRGHTVTAVVRTGIPAEAILAEASEPNDIVVMSTHGRSGVDRWFLGSVADAVVRHGDIPVLVVRSWVTLDKPEDEVEPEHGGKRQSEEATPLVVAGIAPVIPVPDMHQHEEVLAAAKAAPAKRTHRPEARGRQLR